VFEKKQGDDESDRLPETTSGHSIEHLTTEYKLDFEGRARNRESIKRNNPGHGTAVKDDGV